MMSASLLTACASDPDARADAMTQAVGLERGEVQAGIFALRTYFRITRTDAPLTVYIEGDGRAWQSRYQASTDPTPYRAIGMGLAVADTAFNVLYLARPCQFVPMSANPRCAEIYWTQRRYADEVVESIDSAVTHYMRRLPGQRVNLVGYSGGGALTVLVAARRTDVASLRTVAGNLDHVAVNRLHQVTPMPDSLNAIHFAKKIAVIPQIHISGSDDEIVPMSITNTFVSTVGECARLHVVKGMAHEGNWSSLWKSLLSIPLPDLKECNINLLVR
jgi:pimeloyl-ACP methyl ester carboxylesterase